MKNCFQIKSNDKDNVLKKAGVCSEKNNRFYENIDGCEAVQCAGEICQEHVK